MGSRYALITGATHGIGLATAAALARIGYRVLIHGRNADKGQAVLRQLRVPRLDAEPRFLQADFASLAQVRALAAQVEACVPQLDVLINNAGCAFFSRQLSADGYEMTFAVNHLAPFLLTNLLLPLLGRTADARIVTVASEAHRQQHIDFDDLMSERDYQPMRTYGRSKLANILFTRQLAKRLTGSTMTANALHPGVVNTGLGQNNLFARMLGRIIMPLIGISAQRGSETSVYLATSAELAGRTGGYYSHCRPAALRTTPEAVSEPVSERLWQVSERLVTPH